MKHILGIAAFHRDAAAALLVDGRPVAAAQESQFTRTPLDPAFPSRAIRFCLDHAGLPGRELDQVVFYEKPLRKFERILAVQLQSFPRSSGSFAHGMFLWLGDRLWIKSRIARDIGVDPTRIRFTEHQLALAAAAYYPSPFDEAAVLNIDDVGEWATTSIGVGRGASLELLREVDFPDSLGLVASAITQFLGFVPGEEEHKVEALAAFGTPTHADALRSLVPEDNGFFHVDQAPFRFAFDSQRLHGDSLADLLGPPRYSGDPLAIAGADTRHADIAASLQLVLEERVLALAGVAKELVSGDALCVAGQLASNRRLVTRLATDGPFGSVFVPAATDKAGGALGAALYAHHRSEEATRNLSGIAPDLGETVDARAEPGARTLSPAPAVTAELARRLLAGERVAWARGRIEFGDHSSGHRVVLAVPSPVAAANRLLGALQHSESFLPCRLAITTQAADTAFDWPGACARTSRGGWQVRATDALRAAAPAAVAPDGTVSPLVVDATGDPELHALLGAIGAETGTPALLLADFRARGGTLVRTEADAVQAFHRSTLDALVVSDRLYEAAPR